MGNFKLVEIQDNPSYILRTWEIRYGKYYMGKIMKRGYGRGTPLSPHEPYKVVYIARLIIQTEEGKGVSWGDNPYFDSLKEAKVNSRKLIEKFTKALTKT